MEWETVIGLETHAQLSTRSKMFSGASTAFGAAPNTQASAVDIALPGALPVANRGAVELAIRFGLEVGGTIRPRSVFARKNYFYPDLPKGYQISQYEAPIVEGGAITIALAGGKKTIRLTRAHLEEDAGKLLHEDFHGMSGVDFNRAGIPLLEIVSEPDMRSAEEAVAYARELHDRVRWIKICDGDMEQGAFRCDANVSVRRRGEPLGTRCEIKNLNSFRFLERAILYEVRRQIEILEAGGRIVQETRLYDPDRDETRSMRTKEDAHDYRYFPDPDLPQLVVSEEWKSEIRKSLPPARAERRREYVEGNGVARSESRSPEENRLLERFISEHSLTPYDAALLTESREKADYFDSVVAELDSRVDYAAVGDRLLPYDERPLAGPAVKADIGRFRGRELAKDWLIGDLAAALKRDQLEIAQSPLRPVQLAGLIGKILDDTVSLTRARRAFPLMWASAKNPEDHLKDDLAEALGLSQISDAGELEAIVDQVLAENPKQVEDYRAGKEKALNSLVGQVMKATKGEANPAQVNEILKNKLAD